MKAKQALPGIAKTAKKSRTSPKSTADRKSAGAFVMKKAEPDRAVILRIGKLLQATRKHLGINQTSVAPMLGLDQSALSRVESGKQMLTATQWFTFCQIAGISPDSLTHGLIEIEGTESAIRLPQRYTFEKHSKVRALLPLIHYAETTLGERGFNLFLEEHKLDSDFFLNLNAEINFNFTIDLAEALIRKTGMNVKEAEQITRTAGEGSSHGSLRHFYDRIYTNQLELIAGFVSQAAQYDGNFKYEIIEQDKTHLDLSITPMSHMKEFDYRDNAILGDFMSHYERGFLQNLSTYGGQKPAKITLLENSNKGVQKCLYRVKAAR